MPIIDAHAFFGAPPESVRVGTFAEIESVLAASRINAAILASARAEMGDIRRGNEALQQAIAGRVNVFGYCCVNPSYPEESAEEVRRRLADAQFVGLKLPRVVAGPRIDSEGFRAILQAARRYGKPVLIDTTSAADVRDVIALAQEFHTLKFVLGSMGEGDWETAIRACEPHLNTVLEIGSLEADRDKVGDAVAAVGPRRVLFGSHFPRLHPLYVLGMVRDADLDDRDRDRIVHRNARELFELDLANEPLGAQRAAQG